MNFPKKLKYRKYFKQGVYEKSKFKIKNGKILGHAGLQAFEYGNLRMSEIEACRISIRRKLYKKIRSIYFWVKIYPYVSYTKKSKGMRMGKGKGSRQGWVSPVCLSHIMYELKNKKNNYYYFSLFKALALSWCKLSVKSKVILKIF